MLTHFAQTCLECLQYLYSFTFKLLEHDNAAVHNASSIKTWFAKVGAEKSQDEQKHRPDRDHGFLSWML